LIDMQTLLAILLIVTAIFMIFLILIQRGKGGGLAGAFGGLGGQSAFGTKAGDKIMWVTVYVAAFWIIMCVISVRVMSAKTDLIGSEFGPPAGTTNSKVTAPPEKSDGKATGASATDSGKGTDAGKGAESGAAPAAGAPAATDSGASSTAPATAPADGKSEK
jgi:preprotein translocase subunit SecG